MSDKLSIFFYELLGMAFFSYGIIQSEQINLSFLISLCLCAPISGGHINPAVTFSKLLLKQCSFTNAIVYWCGQLLGAFLGSTCVYLILGKIGAPEVIDENNLQILGLSEVLGTFIFILLILLRSQDQGMACYLAVTAGLAIGRGIANPSGGCLNPGIAISQNIYKQGELYIGSSNIYVYVCGPMLGGVLASFFYSQYKYLEKTIYE